MEVDVINNDEKYDLATCCTTSKVWLCRYLRRTPSLIKNLMIEKLCRVFFSAICSVNCQGCARVPSTPLRFFFTFLLTWSEKSKGR